MLCDVIECVTNTSEFPLAQSEHGWNSWQRWDFFHWHKVHHLQIWTIKHYSIAKYFFEPVTVTYGFKLRSSSHLLIFPKYIRHFGVHYFDLLVPTQPVATHVFYCSPYSSVCIPQGFNYVLYINIICICKLHIRGSAHHWPNVWSDLKQAKAFGLNKLWLQLGEVFCNNLKTLLVSHWLWTVIKQWFLWWWVITKGYFLFLCVFYHMFH